MGRKKKELARLMSEHRAQGGELYQSVLQQVRTPHSPLVLTLPLLNQAWKEMAGSVAWRRILKANRIDGVVRVQEEAGDAQGWFPHFHCIWFFEGARSDLEMEDFLIQVFDLWAHYSNKVGAHGTLAASQQLYSIEPGSEYAQAKYLTKHGYIDLDFDPATVDLGERGLTPFEFLTWALVNADADAMEAWGDFEQATRGTNRVLLSRGLQAKVKLWSEEG